MSAGEGADAIAIVEATIALDDLLSLFGEVSEQIREAKARGRGTPEWFRAMKDREDTLYGEVSVQRHKRTRLLLAWREAYRPARAQG